MAKNPEYVENAIGRRVPTVVNGKPQAPYQGVGAGRPERAKHGPRVRSCAFPCLGR